MTWLSIMSLMKYYALCLVFLGRGNVCLAEGDSWSNYHGNFQCQQNGVCFDPMYNKNNAPNKDVTYIELIPPKKTYLRKVDVFESTVTLDCYKFETTWKDWGIQLKNSTKSWIGVEHTFKNNIWVPELVIPSMKTATTKYLDAPSTGSIISLSV